MRNVWTHKHMIIGSCVLLVCISNLSGCVDVHCSYLDQHLLGNGWYENTALRNTGSQFFGMEKWCSATYEINGKYPASLTVTTIKTLVLSDESDIASSSRSTIEESFQDAIHLEESSSGHRTLSNTHQTWYSVYNGTVIATGEAVKIISEIWNCAESGTSVVCLGIAYLSSNEIADEICLTHWDNIVQDPQGSIENRAGAQGFIDNILCH